MGSVFPVSLDTARCSAVSSTFYNFKKDFNYDLKNNSFYGERTIIKWVNGKAFGNIVVILIKRKKDNYFKNRLDDNKSNSNKWKSQA